jgi:hypothetical protein
MKHRIGMTITTIALLFGCGFVVAQDATTEAAIGGALGGALGGATGAVIGQQVGGRNGAILGGAIGGATGAAIAVDKDGDEHYHTVGNQGPAIIVAPPGGRGSFCPPGQAKKGNC